MTKALITYTPKRAVVDTPLQVTEISNSSYLRIKLSKFFRLSNK
jgi:hypothetical protein